MTAYPGSRALQESAHSRLSLSRNSLESKGLLLTLTRFQTLRFLAPIFCRPVSGSMTGMRRPLASNANSPPVIDARPVEARKTDGDGKGHWTSVAGYGEVFTTTELFDVTAARDHFDGTVEAGECRFCAFDARNREHHARNAGRLF